MDLNHDYIGHEGFLVTGATQRLQMCKCAILALGDLGYTDPPLPDIREFIGAYTDRPTAQALESAIRRVLEIGELCAPEELVSVSVTSPVGGDKFEVQLVFTFGTEVVDVPAIL